MSADRIHVFGGGGLARCIWDIFRLRDEECFLVVQASQKPHFNCDFVSEEEIDWSRMRRAFVAVGDNFQRYSLLQKVIEKSPNCEWVNCIHPSATVARDAQIGDGVYIGANSVIGPGVQLGRMNVINAGVTIEHDSLIGDYCNIGTGCSSGGGFRMGDRAVLGVGVSVNHNCSVGDDCVVGSGSCVVRDLPEKVLALGVPARVVRARKFGDRFL